jgi:hypothetical protein
MIEASKSTSPNACIKLDRFTPRWPPIAQIHGQPSTLPDACIKLCYCPPACCPLRRFRGSVACACELVRYGGIASLYRGLPVRCARVFAEVGLQFALFDAVSGAFDKILLELRLGVTRA